METYNVFFLGRKIGSTGMFYEMSLDVSGNSKTEAMKEFWDNEEYEIIDVTHIERIK